MTYTAHCSNGITSHDVVVTVDKRLDHMPYAQAGIRNTIGGSQLISYETLVCEISFNWLRCYGTFSQSTRRHIGAYLKEKAPRLNYYDAKRSFENNVAINILTGEELPILKIEKEDSTMKSYTIKNTESTIDVSTITKAKACINCDCNVATPEDGLIEEFHVVNGVVYCDDCFQELFVECAECGEIIAKEDAIEIDGEWYCKDCVDEHFVKCYECGEYVRKDDATEVDGEWYCESCRDDECFFCELCDEWHVLEDATWIESEDRYVCSDCLDNYYFRCEHCDEWYRNRESNDVHIDEYGNTEEWCYNCANLHAWRCEECDELYSDEVDSGNDGDYICPECRGSRCQDTGDIRTWKSPECREGYHFKPVPCMCATDAEIAKAGIDWMQNIVFYGFELEIDRKQKCYEENEWSAKIVRKLPSCYCKTDCSLSKGGSYSGIEIVSHPATLAWYEERRDQFQDCFEMLREGGWLSHDAGTCGLHVHLSLHALEQRNDHAINNMLFLFDRFWDKLVKFSRRTNRQLDEWAKRYSTAHDEYDRIKEMAKLDRDRYMAINLTNPHTVEIRMFRGTLNLESFFATLQLVDTIVERCIEIGSDYRRLQTITWEEFVASDHEDLNNYLKRRGLVEGSVEEPEPTESGEPPFLFEEGMRVRCVSPADYNASFVGREGEVRTVDEDMRLPVLVHFDNGRDWWCEADSLEIIQNDDVALFA